MPSLSLNSCVTLGKSLNFPEPQCSLCEMKIMMGFYLFESQLRSGVMVYVKHSTQGLAHCKP